MSLQRTNLGKLRRVCVLVERHPVAPGGLVVGAAHLVRVLRQDVDARVPQLDLDLAPELPVLIVLVLLLHQLVPFNVLEKGSRYSRRRTFGVCVRRRLNGFLGLSLNDRTILQPPDIGWPTGNGKKLINSQACCLAQLCLAAT